MSAPIAQTGYVAADARGRFALGRYHELAPGEYVKVTRLVDGTLILEPIPFPKEGVA